MENLLTVEGIAKSFDGRRVLRDVSFTVRRGEVLGLVGINGAGKTTVLDLLTGRQTADSGEVTLAGELFYPSSPEEAHAAGVGVIEQGFTRDPETTVAQAIFAGTFNENLPEAELEQFAATVIADNEMDLAPSARLGDLARAEQVLVEVLRIVQSEVHLVVMDEPTAVMPDYDVAIMHAVVRRLTSEGRAVVYVSHRLDEIRSIADRIAVLREGRISALPAASEVTMSSLAQMIIGHELTANERVASKPAGPILEVSELTVGDALADVSFTLRSGEVFGLTGARRSGVGELVRALVGEEALTSGSIRLEGEEVRPESAGHARELGIGYLAESAVREARNTTLAKAFAQIKRGEAIAPEDSTDSDFQREVERLRDVVRLIREAKISTSSIDAEVDRLSGGDKQKALLLERMYADGKVLVLDSPSQGIDIEAREVVARLLSEAIDSGLAVVLLSQDMSELMKWSHRIGIVREGQLVTVLDHEDANEDVIMGHVLADPDLIGS